MQNAHHLPGRRGLGALHPIRPVHVDFRHLFGALAGFLKKNVVMTVALVAALITSIIVPIDSAYAGHFDVKTLTCLFCVLAVVCALKNINFFYILARKVVICFKNARLSILVLGYITFIGSMLIANDMALLTFLPLGYFVLNSTGKHKYMAFTFIMQNIAANLGGMLTPFGNPQNLYLYTKFQIPTMEFMGIMAVPFVAAILLSQFTENYADLLVGVNIGGTGTLIASLASLITFNEYTKHNPGKGGYYIGLFSAFNF